MSSLKHAISLLVVVSLLTWLAAMLGFGIDGPQDLTVLLLSLVVSSATYFDLTTHRIPNGLTYGAVLMALVWHGFVWTMAWQESVAVSWQDSLLGGTLCGAMMFGLWQMKAIGGGDVKLAIALGLFMGLVPAVTGILMAHLVAAGFVVAWLGARCLVASGSLALPAGWMARLQLNQPLTGSTRLPMAGFYAAGVLLVIWAH